MNLILGHAYILLVMTQQIIFFPPPELENILLEIRNIVGLEQILDSMGGIPKGTFAALGAPTI